MRGSGHRTTLERIKAEVESGSDITG